MIQRILFSASVIFVFSLQSLAQDFSGLLNKKLNRAEDLGTMFESLIGRIGGSVEGSVDSVIVTGDYANELHLKIYYTDFINAYFTISTMNIGRQRELFVGAVEFSQAEKNSPAECILKLNPAAAKEASVKSPYLRIDISKRTGSSGKVRVYALQKNWQVPGGTATPNMLIRAELMPVGVAAQLNPNSDNNVMPAKRIRFNKAVMDNTDGKMKLNPTKTSGGNALPLRYSWQDLFLFADISGTWLNTNTSAPAISKLIITNNNHVRVFRKPSGGAEYEAASAGLTTLSPTQYRAQLIVDNKAESAASTATLDLNLVNNQLLAKYNTMTKISFQTIRRSYDYTFQRQVIVKPIDPGIFTMEEYKVKLPPKNPPVAPSTAALGAGNDVINLWDEIAVDDQVDFSNSQDISSISMTVIPDKNPYSGIYYILPADFHLIWNPMVKAKKGYGLTISYGKQTGEPDSETTDAPVRMSAILTAGISPRERSFVRNLLKANFSNFKEIQHLPLRDNIETTFPSALSALYNIPADRISVSTPTDFHNTITVAWRTDADTKEFIQTALTSGEGIAASVILKPRNEQLPDIQVGATISLADPRSFGKMDLDPASWRKQEWRNQTSFPLKLRYLHVMKKSATQNAPVIYSWSLNNLTVPSQARVSFTNNPVPVWLDTDPTAKMWLDYSVEDCASCRDSVIVAVTDGVPTNLAQQIKLNIPPAVFDSLMAVKFKITIRSRQADPRGGTVMELPVVDVTKEPGKNFYAGPLFIFRGGQPEYEFNVVVETSGGDFYISDQWIPSTEKELLLGTTRMKALFKGIIPGLE